VPKFTLTCHNFETGHKRQMIYDSSVSTLNWKDTGLSVIQNTKVQDPKNVKVAKMEKGKGELENIKIQLGLSCNYSCSYCSQRFVPRAKTTNYKQIDDFVKNMDNWYYGNGKPRFEFWGGEPLVYWKTLKPLAIALKNKYPNATMGMVTNGSLLDKDKNDFLEEYGFSIGMSHDAIGQKHRGPDPFLNPESKASIIDLFKRLAPKGRMSFNSMIHLKNISREAIQKWFENFVEKEIGAEYLQYLKICEGGFIDAYDEGGLNTSLLDGEKDIEYRIKAASELRKNSTSRFTLVDQKAREFIKSLRTGRIVESLPQKCGMSERKNVAVDLNGNVLTCQNVSSVSTNPKGISHHIGHVNNLDKVEIKTGTHWSDRPDCPKCPVIQLCKGSCLFLSGELWEASCNNAYSDNVTMLCNVIDSISGYFPIHIEGDFREDRKDIFWALNGKPNNVRKNKKVFKDFKPQPVTIIRRKSYVSKS
tara:strand:+ start:402 stop:1826 length:1425 start_codon:yes stop_codon:yes gene_type:complete